MKQALALLLILAGCGRGDQPAENRAEPAAGRGGSDGTAPAPAPAASVRLAGLYEGGAGAQKNQMCIVETGGRTQFGLVVWGANLHSCSGAGDVVRDGERLSLRMTGDETCAIAATLRDGIVTLPATLPAGCAYYCGARASLAGARFARSGDDASRAVDIAGDPLCG